MSVFESEPLPLARATLMDRWSAPKLGGLLCALILLAYAPTYLGQGAGFIWDDPDYVINNANLRDWAGLVRTWTMPASLPQWYPLVHTTFWVEFQLWGLSPVGFHVVNVLLHAAGALLLWRVLLALQLSPTVSWFGAAFWALHPVQVESVAWITERKNTLSGVMYFGCFLALLKAGRGSYRKWYVAAAGLFVLALLSKTVTASLPAAYLVIRWWKTGRLSLRRDILPMVPLLGVGFLLAMHTAHIEVARVGAHGPDWDWSPAERGLIAGRALWDYLACLVWPVNLAFVYERVLPVVRSVGDWLYPVAAAVVLASLWFGRRRWGRGPAAAGMLFVGTLSPALGFANVYPHRYSFVADHFQYLACVSVLVCVAWALSRGPRAVASCLVVVFVVMSFQRALIFRDERTLWDDTARKSPGNAMVWANVARVQREGLARMTSPEERWHAGELNFEALGKAATLPASGGIRSDGQLTFGYANEERGALDNALQLYVAATQSNPSNAQAWYYLARLDARQGRSGDAMEHARKALKLEPGYSEASRLIEELTARGNK